MSQNGGLAGIKKTYENALRLLNTRRRLARPKTSTAVRQETLTSSDTLRDHPNVRGKPSLCGMKHWLGLLGHSEHDVDKLNIIHVAGTKGKGSTCAFTRSFLQAHGLRTGFPCKVGLYTSPDLRCIRERIQIDSKMIGEEMFAAYFFEVWDRLSNSVSSLAGVQHDLPKYLQFLALLAIHTFIREGVDAVVMETHHGGEYDATNVVARPIVTAITSIGLDHIAQLGPNIENIAWHKAGIFKTGSPAFTSLQDPAVSAMLECRAVEKGVDLRFIQINELLPANSNALKPAVQRLNCSLALALVDSFLRQKTPTAETFLSDADIETGLTNFHWPGRFELLVEGTNRWFLDGAHNDLSIRNAIQWFSQATGDSEAEERTAAFRKPQILIFSHFSDERDGLGLLQTLLTAMREHRVSLENVIFTTYQEKRDGKSRIDKSLKKPENPYPDMPALYAKLYRSVEARGSVATAASIEEALDMAAVIGKEHGGMNTLITGSLHLVGGALNQLRPLK